MAIKIVKRTGDLAQTSVTLPTLTGTAATITSGSGAVTLAAAVAGLTAGQPVTGTGVAPGTTVASVTGTALVLSQNATATGSAVALSFGGEMQVIGLGEWSIEIKLKTPDATTTDDAAWESFLPSSKSWTAKAKFIFYDGDPSQSTAILATINAPGQLFTWNFFPDAVNSDVAFTGGAFVEGISFGAGTGKVIGLDVSLKGSGPLTLTAQIAPVANPNTNTGQQAEL